MQLISFVFESIHSFYRATRMHSADYVVARCPSVRPSVCHTAVLCLNDYTGTTGSSNARGYEKNYDSRPISRSISQIMQHRAMVTMEGQ